MGRSSPRARARAVSLRLRTSAAAGPQFGSRGRTARAKIVLTGTQPIADGPARLDVGLQRGAVGGGGHEAARELDVNFMAVRREGRRDQRRPSCAQESRAAHPTTYSGRTGLEVREGEPSGRSRAPGQHLRGAGLQTQLSAVIESPALKADLVAQDLRSVRLARSSN